MGDLPSISTDSAQPVGVGKVTEGRMEDVERLTAVRCEVFLKPAVEGVEFDVESRLILAEVLLVCGIGNREARQ